MFNLKTIVRPNILKLKPYSSARDEYTCSEGIFLDANENPYGKLNRYPDPYQEDLKEKLALYKKVNNENIFIGNGSDEVIDLVFRLLCEPGKDKALTFTPTYGMYKVSADINDVELIELSLNNNFEIEIKSLKNIISDIHLKIIIICSPNNPTGNIMNKDAVGYILNKFNGIILIDEAYIDFCKSRSMISQLNKYPNLIISQTFSKAWGLAAARIGTAYACKEIIKLLNRIKPPYNISRLNQNAATDVLMNIRDFNIKRNIVLRDKENLAHALSQIRCVVKVYPSDTNFLLVKVNDAGKIYNNLKEQNIITRNRHALLQNCLRITVGTKDENKILTNALKKI